jgi:hypothetical protein
MKGELNRQDAEDAKVLGLGCVQASGANKLQASKLQAPEKFQAPNINCRRAISGCAWADQRLIPNSSEFQRIPANSSQFHSIPLNSTQFHSIPPKYSLTLIVYGE